MSARLAAGDRVSEYVLLEKVGEGGFGEVWKARHHEFERTLVAVKVPTDPAFAAQLRVEGRLQHDLVHPHIVHTLGLDPAADPPYFVMEWVDGESLREAIRRRGKLGYAVALEVATQVAEALSCAHARGVVHRDVKPENVLLSWTRPFPPCADAEALPAWRDLTHRTLHARVADFGLGRLTQAAARSLVLSGSVATQEGRSIAGTLAYMAPEQKRGTDSGSRADVYALGMLFYEAATGVPPEGAFRDLSRQDAEAPAAVDEWVRTCLAQAPEDRFADAGEALASLRAAVGEGPPAHVAAPLVFRTGREVRTLAQLVEGCDAERDDAIRLFRDGEIEAWLRRLGDAALARRAMELRESGRTSEEALETLVAATGQAPPPRAELDPAEVVVEDLARAGDRRVRVYVTNRGRGWLSGDVEIPAGVRWVRPSATRFEGGRSAIELLLLTDGLEVGQSYATSVRFRTNGGDLELPVRVHVVPRPARLHVKERRYWVVGRGRTATLPIAVENDGDLLLSASLASDSPWIASASGDVTVKGMRDLDVQVDTIASGATEEAPADGMVRVGSNGGEASVRVRVARVDRVHPFFLVLGAALAYVSWLPGWWSAMTWLGLSTGAWVWGQAAPARQWGLTEAVLDAWTLRYRLTWFLLGGAATIGALALAYAR